MGHSSTENAQDMDWQYWVNGYPTPLSGLVLTTDVELLVILMLALG